MLHMPSYELPLIVDMKGHRSVPASVSFWISRSPVPENPLSRTDKYTHHRLQLQEACCLFGGYSLSVPARKYRLQTVFLFLLHRRSAAHRNNTTVPHRPEPVPQAQVHLSHNQNRHVLSGCPEKYAVPDCCLHLLYNEVP